MEDFAKNAELKIKEIFTMIKTFDQMIKSFAGIIEYRDPNPGLHIHRIGLLYKAFLKKIMQKDLFEGRGEEVAKLHKLRLYQEELAVIDFNLLIRAIQLHDIGKIGLPDSVLFKPGKLTAKEFEEIKNHTIIGAQIIDNIEIDESSQESKDFMHLAKQVALNHHERWNGKGYPYGLHGEEIPLIARIFSIIDVYDALSNPRIYKNTFPHDVSIGIIVDNREAQFDPILVDVLEFTEKEFDKIREEHES
jgi:putative two-component system response regulator